MGLFFLMALRMEQPFWKGCWQLPSHILSCPHREVFELNELGFFCDFKDCRLLGPLSMEFPRQDYWSGLPFPSPGDLPNPEIKLAFPALAGGFFTTEPPEKHWTALIYFLEAQFLKQLTKQTCAHLAREKQEGKDPIL